MMPDPQGVTEFERGFAVILDVLDRLKKLPVPSEPDGVQGILRWMAEFRRAVDTMPNLPDVSQLTQFAEDVAQSISQAEKAAETAARGARAAGRVIGSINTSQEPPLFLMPEQRLYRAKVTAVETGDNGWIVHVSANPVAGEVIDTDITLTLKATSQPAEGVLPVDPDTPTEMRVGFRNIDIGDYVAYVPYASYDQAETTFDGVLVPHAGDAAEGATETGAYLSTQAAWSMTHFWATITSGAGPTYAWTGDPGYTGTAATEVNGVLGIGAGTRVRMFGYKGEGSEPWFEYRLVAEGEEYEGGPGIDITGLLVSFDYDPLKGLGVEGAGDDAIAVVKLTADMGLQFTAVTGGIEIIPNEDLGIAVDGDGVAVKLEAEATSSLAFGLLTGEVTHLLQAPDEGVGLPTDISGENLALSAGASAVFDHAGHFNPDVPNTLIHTTHGAESGTTGLDANGHVVAATRVVPAGTTAGDMLYWNGSAWTILAAPGTGSFVLYSINNVLTWVS